jgi:uncharacterized membrane protein
MRNLSKMPKWPILVLAGAAAACTEPAPTNTVAEANGTAEAANTMIVEPEVPSAANEAIPGTAPSAKAPSPAAAVPPESYAAVGQEPGWALKIGGGRIDYAGNYGEKKINVARPEPKPKANGRRYVTPKLIVDITYARCNDAMSGFGFEHQVTVTADGETYKGCGGARKKEWDM